MDDGTPKYKYFYLTLNNQNNCPEEMQWAAEKSFFDP